MILSGSVPFFQSSYSPCLYTLLRWLDPVVSITLAFIVSAISTLLLLRFNYLHLRHSGDSPGAGIQKFHTTSVPRIGGVGILVGLTAGVIVQGYNALSLSLFGLSLIGVLLPGFLSGLAEDLTKRVRPSARLFATSCSASLGGLFLGAWLTRVDIASIDQLLLGAPMGIVFTCFAVSGVAHAFNLIDGFNGLASMVGILALLGLAYVAYIVGDRPLLIISLTSVGAIAGFVVWNYPRGLIFLGDGGAYLIGLLIAELAILLVVRNPAVSAWFPLMLVFYPVLETLFSICRRIVLGRKHPGLPDAAHLHQLIYRRVVRWAVGTDALEASVKKNSMTSPYLWLLASVAVVPAVWFWSNTLVLQLTALLFMVLYLSLYVAIAGSRFPRWLRRRRQR